MRSFELVYELKQQTPIIHFQYDQIGAALRATEVKPKLDRYIAKQYWKLTRASIPEQWLITDGKGALAADAAERKGALNYRMVIKSEGEEHVELGRKTPYDIYYGNSGRDKPILGSKSKKLSLKLICTVRYKDNRTGKTLLEFMNEMIPSFFITHNFGSMQRKGFGSYVIGSPNRNEIAKALTEHYEAACCYYFAGGNDPMKRIQLIYGIMKSGVNFGGYRRSLLFLYMHDNKIGNEKAWLKNQGMAPTNVGRHAAKSNARRTSLSAHPHHYVRAFLGTGEKIEFLKDLNNPRDKAIIGISSATIERYKSPIFFKIIGEWVFYIADKSNPTVLQKLKNSVFEFESDFNSEKNTLTVPSSFDIEAFLEYCHRELNLDQDALNNKYRNSGYKALCEFSQMKNKEESDKDERFQINIISKGVLGHE